MRGKSWILVLGLGLAACAPEAPLPSDPVAPGTGSGNPVTPIVDRPPVESIVPTAECPHRNPNTILVDATHDGGVWWFPQAGSFSPDQPHQGRSLAEYLRIRGFTVRELPRGVTVAFDTLAPYEIVLRAGNFGAYTKGEIEAYQRFVRCPRTLLLVGEFLRPGERDALADSLGVPLSGWLNDPVTRFADHAITAGQGELPYIAGSRLDAGADTTVVPLAWAGTEAVMGVQRRYAARFFWLGDLNLLEMVPLPLVNNLIAWF